MRGAKARLHPELLWGCGPSLLAQGVVGVVEGPLGISIDEVPQRIVAAALGALAEQVGGRITTRLAALGDQASPRQVVHAVLDEFLPTDDASRQAMLLFIAFHTASLTDPSLARAEALQVPKSLVAFLADQLRQAQRQGATGRDIDPDKEATVLVTTLTGLAQGVLGNNFTVQEAAAIVDYSLDRLFQRAEAPPIP